MSENRLTLARRTNRPRSEKRPGRASRPAAVLDRRRFLKASSGLLLGLGLAQVPGTLRAGSSPPAANGNASLWKQLAGSLEGHLLLPGDDGFSQIAQPWNLRFSAETPAAIARCVSTDDVRSCVLWAPANGISLVARSGGHSYAGYSTTTGLMIDLSLMNHVDYDADSGMVRTGGGARNADVYAGLRSVGHAVTHGRCGAVGVAGLVLGGGVGFNQRRKGLLCDQLMETEVVTASGELLRCNDQEHSDLLWACRGGGGGNFGINTSFRFQTFPVDTLSAYQIIWTGNLDTLLPAALNLLPTTTERLGCKLSVINSGGSLSMELLGQLEGRPDELRALLDPLYALATPSQETVRDVAYWDAQDFLSEEGTPAYSHERSRYVFRPLPPEGPRAILDALRRWPGTQGSAIWKMFLAGAAVAAVPPDATAFVHRSATMISSIELDWTADDSIGTVARNESWLADFHDSMQEFTSDQCYQNFIDEAQTDYLHSYYGANLPRLVQTKRRYDPDNVFHYAQGIPLSLGDAAPLGEAGTRLSARV